MASTRLAGMALGALLVLTPAACDVRDTPVAQQETAETSTAMSEDDYVERANALCAELGREIERLAEESFDDLGRAPTREQERAYHRQSIELQQQTLAQLRALPPPEGDEETVERIYDQFERALEELGSPSPSRDAAASVRRFDELAKAYGLRACAD